MVGGECARRADVEHLSLFVGWQGSDLSRECGEFPAKRGGGLHFGMRKALRISCWLVASIPIATPVEGISVAAKQGNKPLCNDTEGVRRRPFTRQPSITRLESVPNRMSRGFRLMASHVCLSVWSQPRGEPPRCSRAWRGVLCLGFVSTDGEGMVSEDISCSRSASSRHERRHLAWGYNVVNSGAHVLGNVAWRLWFVR